MAALNYGLISHISQFGSLLSENVHFFSSDYAIHDLPSAWIDLSVVIFEVPLVAEPLKFLIWKPMSFRAL